MGREIRRVPGDWQHPRYTSDDTSDPRSIGQYRSLYDEDYEHAAQDWLTQLDQWRSGAHPDQGKSYANDRYFWDYQSPPNKENYRERAWTEAEATHYQVYETVSEGSPITPAFATKEELIQHLITIGDDWDGRWSEKAARKFVETEWAPSMTFVPNGPDAGIYTAQTGFPGD